MIRWGRGGIPARESECTQVQEKFGYASFFFPGAINMLVLTEAMWESMRFPRKSV